MKDIQYFLDVEDKYCQTIPEEVEVWDEDVQEWDYKRIPLDFLRSRPFYQSYNNLDYRKERTQGYDLNDAELTVLGMFFMHCSAPFRDDYYTQKGDAVPEIAKRVTGGHPSSHLKTKSAMQELKPIVDEWIVLLDKLDDALTRDGSRHSVERAASYMLMKWASIVTDN